MFLIIAPAAIFCVFVAKELMNNFSYGLGLPVMIAAVVFTAYVSITVNLFNLPSLVSTNVWQLVYVIFGIGCN
jgi:hypothetical protein